MCAISYSHYFSFIAGCASYRSQAFTSDAPRPWLACHEKEKEGDELPGGHSNFCFIVDLPVLDLDLWIGGSTLSNLGMIERSNWCQIFVPSVATIVSSWSSRMIFVTDMNCSPWLFLLAFRQGGSPTRSESSWIINLHSKRFLYPYSFKNKGRYVHQRIANIVDWFLDLPNAFIASQFLQCVKNHPFYTILVMVKNVIRSIIPHIYIVVVVVMIKHVILNHHSII